MKVADMSRDVMELRMDRNRRMQDVKAIQEENQDLKAELKIVRDRASMQEERSRERSNIEQEVMQEIQVMRKESNTQ